MGSPKISVITVSFNQGRFIRQNIESVLAQNYSNFEHIIIDGGSTDGTQEILKSYPHLKWASEEDRGQSHGLNKGFAAATGDIIAWLNSDDWYAPNVFGEIASALNDYPIVLSRCAMTDKNGKVTETVDNVERTWFDLLKYWIYYSMPTQPALFFRRELLERHKRLDGSVLDETLEYCMDFDLFLRITREFPLKKRIPTITANYRMWEDNKTGTEMAAVYREMSRVYSKHSNAFTGCEKMLSFIVPVVDEVPQALESTLRSVASQDLNSAQVVVVFVGSDRAREREARKVVRGLGETYKAMKFLSGRSSDLIEAINRGIFECSSPYFALLEAGMTVKENFTRDAINFFSEDGVGLGVTESSGTIPSEWIGERGVFDVGKIFTDKELSYGIIGRTVAFMEIGGFSGRVGPAISNRDAALRLAAKGWRMGAAQGLSIQGEGSSFYRGLSKEELSASLGISTAKLALSWRDSVSNDSFFPIRNAHGFAVSLPQNIIDDSEKLLSG